VAFFAPSVARRAPTGLACNGRSERSNTDEITKPSYPGSKNRQHFRYNFQYCNIPSVVRNPLHEIARTGKVDVPNGMQGGIKLLKDGR